MPTVTPPVPANDPAVAALDAFITKSGVDTAKRGWRTSLSKPPQPAFTAGKTYSWVLATSQGEVRVKPDTERYDERTD